MTAQDIIADALCKLGVYAPGETITSADLQTGFNCLNDMLDNWSNQSLAAYANTDSSVALTEGKFSYTVGTGGDINIPRPLAINAAPGSAYIVDVESNVYPVNVIDQSQWNSISSRNVSGTWPEWIFYDPQFPLAVLNCWPTPSAGYTLHFTSRILLSDAASETSTIALPPGYAIALKYNLAVELIPYFPEQSKESAAIVVKQADKTLGDLKRTNSKVSVATFDSTITTGAPVYNIYTDR